MPRSICVSSFRLSVRPSVRSFVCTSFCYVCGIYDKVLVKVSPVVSILVTTFQKAFIFGPQLFWRVVIINPDTRVGAPANVGGQNLDHI